MWWQWLLVGASLGAMAGLCWAGLNENRRKQVYTFDSKKRLDSDFFR